MCPPSGHPDAPLQAHLHLGLQTNSVPGTPVVTILHDRTEALEKGRLYEQLKQASEKLEDKVRGRQE
jgi:hypothetical protein